MADDILSGEVSGEDLAQLAARATVEAVRFTVANRVLAGLNANPAAFHLTPQVRAARALADADALFNEMQKQSGNGPRA